MASSGLIKGGSLFWLHRAMLTLSSSCVICSIYGFSYLRITISTLYLLVSLFSFPKVLIVHHLFLIDEFAIEEAER